ncbi:hypothetical protein HYH02_004210 [Chlamydomonas schloesseri]|uniref:Uncharacterized protein n=1 Tax=Chlamydomonas schloesseri TaxID=2026947 RepID=A0A836B8J7_9CHLO|nr:hypothetical protein HYH02_004210 [Chlamydomonas schloesseri]|eukprot:KAG2450937.1 hypothetical protein HYH02_004210 [Chlamydomonas schloesseri]
MAATSPLVRLRRLALPLALVALCAAAAHGQTLSSAVLTASNTISATLSNSTTSADCRAAFAYLDSNNATKAATPFANCTASGTAVTLILASGVSYAAGDQLNIKVNQTTLNTTAGAAFVPAAAAVAVQPVLVSATLTAASTLAVKLPLSGNSVPTDFGTNMTVCGGALQLLSAAGTAKSSPFTACALSGDVVTLTLAGAYASGDTVNVVAGQTFLKFGTTAYARNATSITIAPTLVSVTLASTTSIAVGSSAPVALPANASAAVCNSIFDFKLSNGTLLPAAFASCSVGPAPTTVTAVFANGTSYVGGMTINLRANQTSLVAAPAGPLVIPLATPLAISPTILSASLTTGATIVVALPVASATSGTFDAAACNSVFELRSAGAATATATPFTDCTLSTNGLTVTLTLAAGKYKAGDNLNVKSTNTILNVAGTNYVPKAVPVLPSITAAFLISSTVVSVSLPVPSALPAVYAASDCARSIIIAAANSTVAKPIASCALGAGATSLLVTLGSGATFASGDTVNVQPDQWTLRAGQTVTVGPTYVPSPAPVAIMPAFTSAALTAATTIVVRLPAASALATGDCNNAFQLVSGGASPFASCALGAGNTTLTLNLTASTEYTVGYRVSPKTTNTLLTVGNTSYAYLPVAINPILLPSTTAVLVSPTSIVVTLPFTSYLPPSANATHCNAAFELKSAAGTAKTAPFTACVVSGGTTLTLTVAAGTYTAGDTLGVKANNTIFLGASSSGPAYVPATAPITITPTIVSAALVGTSTVFVTLSAPATLNTSACNSAFVVTGKTNVFANCTLSADSLSVTLMLTTPSSVVDGDTINVVASQTSLMAGTVAFIPASPAATVSNAVAVSAHLTAITTVVVKLSVASVASSSFASSCNSVFSLALSNGTVKSNPFSACTLTDSKTVTLTIGSTTWTAGDVLNVKAGQTVLTVLDAAGPAVPVLAAAVAVAPAITSAVATSSNTIVVPLPLASDIGGAGVTTITTACASVLSITPSTSSTTKTVQSCVLSNNGTILTVTIDGSGSVGTAAAPFAAGDKIAILSGNSILKATTTAGPYQPYVAVTVVPSIGNPLVTSATTVTLTLAGTTTTDPSPITAAACNTAIGIFAAGSTSPRSSAVSACAISGTTMTLTLGSSYTAGDTVNVVQSASTSSPVMSVGSAPYGPRAAAVTLQPTLVSAKAISNRVILVTLPAASTFVKSATATAALDKTDCDTVLALTPTRTLNATTTCNLNSTSSSLLTVTLDTGAYVPGDAINILSAQALLVAGSTTGPAYVPRSITIDPAYVISAVATAPNTVVVTLPRTSVFNDGSASVGSTLTQAQCAAAIEIKSGSVTRALAGTTPCSISGTALTITLNGTGSDIVASGDTFNFKDTNTLIRDSGSSLAYKAATIPTTIAPQIVSATATAADTYAITLAVAGTFGGSASPTNAQCATTSATGGASGGALVFGGSTKTLAANACNVTGSTVYVKITNAQAFTDSDTFDVASSQTILTATGTNAPAFVGSSVQGTAVAVSPAYLVSAKATAARTIVVTLPVTSSINDGSSNVAAPTKTQCDSIIEVLAGGSATSPRTLAASGSSPCTISGTTLTITLDNTISTNVFTAGDTIRVKSGNTLLRARSATGGPVYVQAAAATPISLGYLDTTNSPPALSTYVSATKTLTIQITFPTTVVMVNAAGSAITSATNTDCTNMVTVSGAGTVTASSTNPTCSLAGSVMTYTVVVGTGYTEGTTKVDFVSSPSASLAQLKTGSATGPLVVPLASAANVAPAYVTTAVLQKRSAALYVDVTFPFDLAALTMADLAACQAVADVRNAAGVSISGAIEPTGAPCAVNTATAGSHRLMIQLASTYTYTAGDRVVILAGQTGIKTSTASVPYAYISTAIRPAYVSGAAQVTTTSIVVTLPYASALNASGTTCPNSVSVVVTGGGSEKAGSCTWSLDSTGTYLTIAALSTLANGDKFTFLATQTALSAGTAGSAGLYTALVDGATPAAATFQSAGATAFPASVTAIATSSKTIEVAMTMASTLNSATCPFITLTNSGTVSSCSLSGTPAQYIQVNTAAAYWDGTGTATTLSVASSSSLLAGTATQYGAANTITVSPTVASAIYIGSNTLQVQLPANSATAAPTDPTCTTPSISTCSAGTATCIKAGDMAGAAPACSAATLNGFAPPCANGGSLVCYSAAAGSTLTCGGTGLTSPICGDGSVAKCSAAVSSPTNTWTLTGGTTVSSTVNPSYGNIATITLGGAYTVGDTLNIGSTPVLKAGNNYASGAVTYTARRTAVTVQPGIQSAMLTGVNTITVTLAAKAAVPSTAWNTSASCNAVFALYASTTATTARTSPFTACSLATDQLTVTLTLSAGVYQAKDYINIVAGQTTLVTYAAASNVRTAFGARPLHLQVVPTIVSAVATAADTIVVALPLPSFIRSSTPGKDAWMTGGSWDCAANTKIFVSTDGTTGGTVRTPLANTACTLVTANGMSVLVYKLASGTYAAGDQIQLVSGSLLGLYGAQDPAFAYGTATTRTVYSLVSTAFAGTIASATAISSSVVEVAMPAPATITSGSSCTAYLTSSTGTQTACWLDGTSSIITMTLGGAYADASTVNVVSSQSVMKYADATATLASFPTATTAIAVKPTIVSAVATSATTLVVTLPAGSLFFSSTVQPGLGDSSATLKCTDVFSIKNAAGTTKNLAASAASACTLTAGATSITITLATGHEFAAGDYINVVSGQTILKLGSSGSSGTNYVPRRVPVIVSPTIVSAAAISATTIRVVLPAVSSLFDASNTKLSRSLTSTECATVLAIGTKAYNATACTLNSNILTVELGSSTPFAPGDTINIVSGQTMLRAGSYFDGPSYIPASAAIPITINFFSSVVASDSKTIIVTLPFPSKIYDSVGGSATSSITTTVCTSIIKAVTTASSFATAIALDGTTPCVISGTTSQTLTIKIASGSDIVAGDKVDLGVGTNAVLMAATTAAGLSSTVGATTAQYLAVATTPSAGATLINPSITSAAATSTSKIMLKLALAGNLPTMTFNASDCSNMVSFTPSKTLATTDACKLVTLGGVSNGGLQVTLSGSGATGVFAAGDTVNIGTGNAAATIALRASSSTGPRFGPLPTAVTVDPNIYWATAISTSKVEIGLVAASFAGASALTTANCDSIFDFNAGGTKVYASANPCVLNAAKTIMTVSFDGTTTTTGFYQPADTANIKSAQTLLRAGADNTGTLYKASTTAIDVNPTFASATATAARTIVVTLPSASSFYSAASGGTAATSLTATECAQVLAVSSAAGVTKALASCALADQATSLTVTLATNETFAAGDVINVLAANVDSATKPLRVGANTGRKYVARSSAVKISGGYILGAFAISTRDVAIQLPVASFVSGTDCSTALQVQSSDATPVTKTLASCAIYSDSTGYYLVATLTSTFAFASGDTVAIKSTNAVLYTGSDNTGSLYTAVAATNVYATIDSAYLVGPAVVIVTMPAAVTFTGGVSKAACDAAFIFTSAVGGANMTSPIMECTLVDTTTVNVTLNSSALYTPGMAINIKKDQTNAKVGGAGGTNLVPYPADTLVEPTIFGSSATLVAPTTIAVPLPGASSLSSSTAADCSAAVRITSVLGEDAASPFASCALSASASVLSLSLASPSYAPGQSLNVKSSNSILRLGPSSGPLYVPNTVFTPDVPILASIATAVLVSPNTVVVNLPAPAVVPTNFTLDECLKTLDLTTAAGVAKNGSLLASCTLSSNRLALTLNLASPLSVAGGDRVNVKPQQAALRVAALDSGPSYVPKALAQVVTPAFFGAANLTAATSVVVKLPFASALASGADCKSVVSLISTAGAVKNVSSCSLAADAMSLTVTLAASTYAAGDIVNAVPGQAALTLADGTTPYVPSEKGMLISPNLVSAALTNATIISVTLPTASVLTGTAAADCNAAVVITRNGSAVASPLSACAVSTDGLTLTLTAAATYKPSTGDMVDVAVNQTVLRAGSATGPAFVPRATAVLVTVPSPPPSPPPSPAPSPPPSPPVSTANYSARGLATGPLSCNVLIGADTVTTTSGNFTGLPSYAGKDASFRGSCKDAVTGAVYTDDTVASTLPAGLTGLILSPVTALASVWDIKSVADLADTNKEYLRLLGVPVNASAYGSATNLLAYDYYVKGFVALETPAVAVLNVEGMVAANLLMYTKFFDGLNASVAGRDISAAEALAAAQYVMAMGLEMAEVPLNTSSPAAILDLLNATYSILTAKNTSAGGRRLMQGSAVSFTQLQAQAAALAAAAADSNALVTVQQQKLIAAINAGTSISAADLTNIITEASKVIVTQSTVIASAATGLGSGAISPASFTSSYTGSALTTLVAQQQLAAPPGTDVTDTPSPPSDDKKSNTGLIVGLVVGLVGGAIVITLIVVFIVMRRRKQNVAAAGQATA